MQSKGRNKLYHSSTKRLGQKGYYGYALAMLHHTPKKRSSSQAWQAWQTKGQPINHFVLHH